MLNILSVGRKVYVDAITRLASDEVTTGGLEASLLRTESELGPLES